MSLTPEQLENYLNKTNIANINVENAADETTGSKDGQTAAALINTKNTLNALLKTVHDQSEKTVLNLLLSALERIPTNKTTLLANIFKLLKEFSTFQESIINNIDIWLNLKASSSSDQIVIIKFYKALYFLLQTLKDDLNPPNKDKIIFFRTILTVQEKKQLLPSINKLLDKAKNNCPSPPSLDMSKIIEKLSDNAYMAKLLINSDSGHEFSELQKSVTSIVSQMQEARGCLRKEMEEVDLLWGLNKVIKQNNLKVFFKKYKNKNLFEKLMQALNLPAEIRINWRLHHQRQFSSGIEYIKNVIFTHWKWVDSYLGGIYATISIPSIKKYMNRKLEQLSVKYLENSDYKSEVSNSKNNFLLANFSLEQLKIFKNLFSLLFFPIYLTDDLIIKIKKIDENNNDWKIVSFKNEEVNCIKKFLQSNGSYNAKLMSIKMSQGDSIKKLSTEIDNLQSCRKLEILVSKLWAFIENSKNFSSVILRFFSGAYNECVRYIQNLLNDIASKLEDGILPSTAGLNIIFENVFTQLHNAEQQCSHGFLTLFAPLAKAKLDIIQNDQLLNQISPKSFKY
ncbi:MAG: hypothetical protein KIT27_01505 [Legionellales bacterium]|nr:hypothetical protein [Legionellales bacterium]